MEKIIHVRLSDADIQNIAKGGTKEQLEEKLRALGFDSSRRLWHSVDPVTGDVYYHGREASQRASEE